MEKVVGVLVEDIFIICGADQLVRKRSKIELINKL